MTPNGEWLTRLHRTVEKECDGLAPRTAWAGPGRRAAWAAGQRLMSHAAFAKVPPRQGHLGGKDALTLGGPWYLWEAGRGLRARVPVCDF